MTTDRAAGSIIYRCEVPRASRSSVSCSLDDPTAIAAAVVAAAVAAAPAAVVAPSAHGVLAWSSVSPTLLSLAHTHSVSMTRTLFIPSPSLSVVRLSYSCPTPTVESALYCITCVQYRCTCVSRSSISTNSQFFRYPSNPIDRRCSSVIRSWVFIRVPPVLRLVTRAVLDTFFIQRHRMIFVDGLMTSTTPSCIRIYVYARADRRLQTTRLMIFGFANFKSSYVSVS